MIGIRGLQKTSMVDYPGKVACTVFLPNCNFRCPFCHNPALINEVTDLPVIPYEEFFDFLGSRQNWLDGVCITGGEPTMAPGLVDFVKKIKSKGFLVKLDTNGSNPVVLKDLLDECLVDYVAMDIKSSLEGYSKAVGVKVNDYLIKESVKLIQDSGVDYEFRTTVVPGLHSDKELKSIGEWLKGSKRYVIQQFRNNFDVLDPSFKNVIPFHPSKLNDFKKIVSPFFKEVIVKV